jgi:hypothetical protein
MHGKCGIMHGKRSIMHGTAPAGDVQRAVDGLMHGKRVIVCGGALGGCGGCGAKRVLCRDCCGGDGV